VDFPKPIKLLSKLSFVFLLLSVACSGTTPAPQATPTMESSPVPDTPSPEPLATETVAVPTDTRVPTATMLLATFTPTVKATAAIAYMTYRDFEIVPAKITIKAGTKVVFLVKSASGDCHEPYSSYPDRSDASGLFDSGALHDGASYAYTFKQPGTITIRCGCHPDMMIATVEVTS